MRKRERAMHVANVLGHLATGEAKRRLRRDKEGLIDPEELERAQAGAIRDTLVHLGPLYIKVGQMLSTRPDIISQTLMDALQDLHEEVNVRPFSEFVPVLEKNMGIGWRSHFKEIDTEKPLGAASIAQVYRGVMSNGRPVAIKLQRPGVAASARLDMEILATVMKFAMKRAPEISEIFQPEAMLENVFAAMRPELDFRLEARNIEEFEEYLERYDHIQVPEVYEAEKEVLIMSLAPGVSVREANVADFPREERHKIGTEICEMIYRGFLVDGAFHGDPHPGNVFVSPGEPATLIDFGIIGKIDRQASLAYTRFMVAMALNDGILAGRASLELGSLTARADIPGFLSDMQRYIPTANQGALKDVELGNNFNQFFTMCTRRGIVLNPGIALFGKASANMEGTLRKLCPELNTSDVFKEVMGGIIKDQALKLTSTSELTRVANELFQAGHNIPEQARYLAQQVVNGQYVLRVRDEGAIVREAKEDARAKAMRRTMIGIAAAALWAQRKYHTPRS